MRLRLPFIDQFRKSGLLFALLLAITFHGNTQGLFSPVADAVNTGGNCYRLTTTDVSRRGAVWYNNKIDLLSDFDIQFTLNFGDRSSYSGGDGMAFVLQPTSTSEIGVAGSAKGYGNDYVPGTYQITTPGISPSMAIEYDTYDDEGGTTGLGTLVLNGDYRHLPGFDGAGTVGLGFLTDGLDHSSRVTWNAATQTITFYVDGIQRFTYQRDLVNVVFGGQHLVYFGFTAATGGSVNQQSVCFDAVNSTFASPLTPTLGQIIDACAGGNTGSATINLQGGTNPFIVALNGVSHVFTQSNITSNSVTFSNLPADIYSVRILESNGFENNDLSFTIHDNPTPSITASGPLTFCQGGSVVLTASAGTSYLWSTGETTQSITVTTSGTYNVLVTNGSCVSTSTPFEVLVNPSPATPILAVSGATEFCEGGSVVISVTNVEGVSYQWLKSVDGGYADPIPGETATSITVTTTGRYTVMATNGCGTIASGTYEIIVSAAPPKPAISASGSLVLCSYNSVVLTSSSATGNTWSNGATTQSITVTPATVGSYSVNVSNGSCSTNSDITMVVNAPAFVSSITASGPTLICDGSSVTYTLNETVPSASRTWYRYFNGQYDPTFNETGLSIVVTKSGNYGVNIIDNNGCFSNPPGSHDVTVLPPPSKPLDFTISSTNACTINSGTVAAIIDFSSGVAPINMTWSDGNGFTTFAQSINNIPPGTYTATVYDYCGTTVVKAVTITGAVTASTITATATTVCTGATTTLRVSDINPLHTYQWYKDGSIINGATGTMYEGSSGNYQVLASDGSCSAFSTSLFISERVVTAPLDFTVTSSNSCAGPNTGMIDQGPFTGGGSSYVNLGWTGPNGFFRDDVSMLSNLAAGTYTLGVRDFCGTVLTKSVTILQGTSFDKNLVINGPQILCSNGASIRITAAAGATSYSWNKTVDGILTNNFANTPFIDVTEAGFYSVIMTDAIGCETYSFAYSIAAPNPPLAITAQSSNSCNASNNGTANITSLVGGNIPYTISWTGPNGYTSSQYSINNLAAGVYTVTARDACGTTVSANVTVLEPAPQPQIMAVSGSTTLCNPESSVTISAYAGAVTYVWQRVVNNVTMPVAGSGNSINATEPGAYYVSMTDANGCFQNSDIVNVYAANPIPLTVDLTSYTNGVSCFNGGGVANAAYSGGTAPITFVGWTGPNGFTSTANNIASLAPGTYIATYRDFCGVEATGSITFTAGDAFALPTVTPSAPFCGSNAVTLTMGATPYSFEWYQYDMINEVFVRTFSPNQNTILLSADAGYYYYPVLKDANNCYGYPTGFSTEAPTPITFSVSSSPSCGPNNGTANIFNIAGGKYPVTYSWTDGASFNSTNGFITNLAPGTYTVTAIDACANAVSQSITITGGIAAATITSTSQNICAGSSAVLSITNYNAAYSYQWLKDGVIILGATGETYAANLQGNYQVEASDGVCNSYSGSIFVNVALPPSLTVFSTPSCGSPNTGSAYVQSVSGGKLPFTYAWTDGGTFSSTAQTVSNLAAGNYAVTVTDACGLQDTKLFTINQLPAVSGTISGVTAICTEGGSTILTASTNGTPATFAWSKIIGGVATYDISSTNTISASETGTYMVNIKDVNGCFSLPSIYVTAAGTPLTLTLTGTQSCGPSTGSVGAIFSGAAPITVSWTDGGTFSSTANFVNNIPGGTYTATATDACGVSVSKVITISGQVTAATITATATNVCVGSSAVLSITNVDPTVTYQWRLNGVDIAGATATSYTAAASGTYTVFASKSGCTTNSAAIVITVRALPTVFNVSVNAPVCPGANSPAFTLSGSQTGTVYSTYLNGVLVKYINNPTVAYTINGTGAPISFSAATIQTSGNYTVVATTSLGGCTSTMNGSADVVVNPRPPVPTITASGSLTICEGETVTLTPVTTSIIPSASFTWSKYDYVAANNSYATTESITVTDGGSYRVVVKDANGCIAASLFTDVFVTIPKTPTVTADGATTICPGGSVNLIATANANQSKNALKFDGSNYAEAPHQSYMGLTKRLSIEAWFKTDDAGATQYIVSKGTNDFTPGQYGLVLTGGKVQFHLSNNIQHYGVVSTTDIQAGKWYHAAGTWDSTTVTLYINGVSEGQSAFIGPMTANTEPLEIGRLGKPLSEYYFHGEIDEVRIWNIALTAEQINAQKGTIINVSNTMVANYRFEEGTGTTLADNGFGNPATVYGSPIWITSTAPFYNYTPTYTWSPGGATTSTIPVSMPGSYTVTVNEGGCTNTSDPIIITSLPVASITASGSLSLLPGQTVTLTASAGTSYLWSNGATTPSIVVSTAEVGTYTVTVTNNGCNTTSAPTIVSEAAGIAPVIIIPADISVNNDPGTCGAIVNFTATETTGNPVSTITYSHAPGSFFPIGITTVTATAVNAAGVSSGTFQVTVTDNEKPVFVITAPGTATVTIPAMQTFVGDCTMIPFNFLDPLPAGTVVTGIDLTYSGQDQGWGYTGGTDDLYVSGTKVASSVYAHETKTFNTTYTGPIPGYVYGGNNVFGFVFTCYPGWQGFINGGTMTIRYTSSFGPKTVNSDAGKCEATLTLTAPNTSDNCGVASVTNDAPATFPVGTTNVNWTATDSHGNTNTISQNITVVDNQAPVVTTQNITVTLTNGTVSITPAQVNNGSTDNCGIASYSLDKTIFDCSNVGTNTVTLTVTDIHGNSASATANVTVNSGGSQATITAGGPTTICTGSSVTLTASAGTGYLWSTGETTQSITVSISGSYTVTASGSSDCPSTSAPTVVTVNPVSTLTITPANPVVCSGSTLILNSTITGGTVATPIVSSLSAGGQASAKLLVGLRRLVSTYAGPAIRLRRSSDNAESDFGFSGNELDLTAINSFLGGSTGYVTTLYDQSGNGVNIANTTGIPNQPTFVANGLNGKPVIHMNNQQYLYNSVNYPSPFTVVYAAKQTGPTRGRMLSSVYNNWLLGWWAGLKGLAFFEGWVQPSSGGVSSNGDTNPYVYTGSSDGSTSSFLYENGTLLANNAGGITGPNGIVMNRSGIYGETSEGDYSELYIFNTVLSTSDRQLVENSAASYYSIYAPLSSVAGPSLTVNPTTTAAYTINAIDVNGCAVANSITVTVNPLPSATITANGPTTFCSGGSVTLTSSSATGNVWSTGATSQSITVSQSGNYSVTVTNGNGCSAISNITTVTVNTPPVVTITAGGPTTFCSGGSVALTASAGSSYLWSTGETTQSITVSQSGNYSVTLTDGNGCFAISTITSVTVNTPSIVTITANGPTSFCNGGSVALTSSSTTGNVWSTGETSPSITVLQSGNYTVTVTDASGCSAVSASTNVTVNTAPVVNPMVTASGPTTLCGGGTLGLSVAAMGGNSLRFNGSNYLEAPSAAGNSLSTALTVELWFKTNNAGATQYLVSKGLEDGSPGHYGLVLVGGGVQLHLGGAGSASINSVTKLNSNTWYHVAGTWDGATGIAKLYLNGVFEGQVATGVNSNLGTNTEPLEIGRLGKPCCPYLFMGEMDEIRIWNVARDAGQIANGRSLSLGTTPNLVTNYHFDEGTGTVTINSAVGGSDATLVNNPNWQVSGAPVNAPNSTYLWSNGETTPNINVNTAGSYTATVTYITTDGCTATGTSVPVSVTNVPAATVTASGPLTFCPGGSVILTASAGSAYSWSSGETTQSITVTQSGNYTVSVTNGLGCTTVSVPVAVSVSDITAPVPDLPSLPVISITPNGLITAPTATDDCSGVSVTGTTTDQVTNLLSGTYTITWNYADASGNTSTQTQTVIVADMAPPSLKAMNRIVKNNDPGVCGAMVTYVMPVANDNASTTKVTINEGGGDGAITFNTPLSQNVTSLDFISVGEYQDIVHGHGVDIAIQIELYNPQSGIWTLVQTVQTGTTDYHFGGTSVHFPAISQVSQIRFTASQPVYAAFHFYEMSVNLNSIAAVQTAGLPSGSVFPIGTTLNTFRAVDLSGNEAFTSFIVEVLDAEKPRMGNYTSVTYPAGANGTWTGSAATIAISDNCGSETLQLTEEYFDQRGNRFYQGLSSVAQGNLVLGNRTFPVGTNTVVVSMRDGAGNISDRARFNVSITDVTAPTIVVSGNMTQTADPGVCAAWVKVPIPVTSDNCSVQAVTNSFNGSPSAAGRYPVGTTVVTWTVTDGSGNKTTAVQTITVIDNEAPVLINVPVSMILTNDAGSCGAVVTWDAVRATDNCGLISFVSNHQSGEIFPLGETVVTFTATDRNGNIGTSSFTITVKDNEAPKVITRPVTVTLVNGSATILPSAINNGSTDNCGAVTLSASKTVFNCADVGINRVTLTVTDVNNNTSSGIALVTVIGETPTSRITVVPSNSTYTGGVSTDIYLGYGPQSVTLSTTVTGTVPVSYNWTGSTGLSCTTCANPVFSPTAAGSYSFTVAATNIYGCTTSSTVTICVRDIRVPNFNGRVYVCHTDLNTGTTTTLNLATNTVDNHLLQNPQDKLGTCGMVPCSQVIVTSAPDVPKSITPEVFDKMSKETISAVTTGLAVKASPNPTTDVFRFIITSAGKQPVHIRLLNEAGKMEESRNNIQLGSAFTMGRSLHSGVYFAEVIQGKERVVVKLIKMVR